MLIDLHLLPYVYELRNDEKIIGSLQTIIHKGQEWFKKKLSIKKKVGGTKIINFLQLLILL